MYYKNKLVMRAFTKSRKNKQTNKIQRNVQHNTRAAKNSFTEKTLYWILVLLQLYTQTLHRIDVWVWGIECCFAV